MSALQRPKCLPAQARRCSGSWSFQAQHFAISGVKTFRPVRSRVAHSTSRVPETASQSEGSTSSAPGRSAAIPTRSSQAAAPLSDLIWRCVLVELALVDEDAPRLRPFIAADDASPLEHIDEPAGA